MKVINESHEIRQRKQTRINQPSFSIQRGLFNSESSFQFQPYTKRKKTFTIHSFFFFESTFLSLNFSISSSSSSRERKRERIRERDSGSDL
jgi:hypothetical protein